MTNKGESFESTVENIEQQYGIIVDKNKNKKPQIVIDSAGRYWRYTEDRSFRWRVRADGSRFYRPHDEYLLRKQYFAKMIAAEKDEEERKLLEEEIEYAVFGVESAQHWADFVKKKEDAKRRGKKVYDYDHDIKPNFYYNKKGDLFLIENKKKNKKKKLLRDKVQTLFLENKE